MNMQESHPLAILAITALAFLVLIAAIYGQALQAGFIYDDAANLLPLEEVNDPASALTYIFSGESGPLGRPIALATFAMQHSAWPDAANQFLLVNILIHLLNGLLLAGFAWQLAQMAPSLQKLALPFCISASLLWLLQPLHASASLHVVQRMTTLCTSFMLLGLIGYLIGRQRLIGASRFGWPIMLLSLFAFGFLAIFTKESGLLLPVYVWVLETTILPQSGGQRAFIWWRRSLYIPLAVLLAYLASHTPHLFDMTHRGFNLWQRLLSEGPILWQYFYLLLLPRASELGPFHDDLIAAQSLSQSPEAMLAWLAWLIVIVAAILGRRRWPWLSFAAAWFLLGHALESTVVNLELYFEHRNYLPSVGILLAICAKFWEIPANYRRTALSLALLYASLLGFVLHEVTSAWGNPKVAGQLWANKHPDSPRALQFLANNLLAQNDLPAASELIGAAYVRHPERLGLGLQKIQLACEQSQDVQEQLQTIHSKLSSAQFDSSMIGTLNKLLPLSEQKKCLGLDEGRLLDLIDALLENTNIPRMQVVAFQLHHLKARMFYQAGWGEPTIQELEAAFTALPDLKTGVTMITLLAVNGFSERAARKFQEIRQFEPSHLIQKRQWRSTLDNLEQQLSLGKQNAGE